MELYALMALLHAQLDIRQDAPTIAENGQFGSQTQAPFPSQHECFADRIHVHGPHRLDHHGRTVVETDPAGTELFHVQLFGIPLPVHPPGGRAAIADVGQGHPAHRYRLRVIHEPKHGIQGIDPNVGRRAESGGLLGDERAAGNAPATLGHGFRIVDVPKVAALHHFARCHQIVGKPGLDGAHEQPPVVPRGLDHVGGVIEASRHGLLHNHVLAGIQGIHGRVAVRLVEGTHMDCIQIVQGHQIPMRVKRLGNVMEVGHFLSLARNDIRDRCDLHVFKGLQSAQVGARDAAGTDDPGTKRGRTHD